MDITVLLKAVPDVERLRFDPNRRAVVRTGTELYPNAFDQRALRVALDLVGGSGAVRVLSLGPPDALPVLREAVALGAASARLLTDPRCAGSDVLATARALVAGLGPDPPPLVLAGARSLDSDTGLVGPEVAGLLDRPLVRGARSLRLDAEHGTVEAVVDTERGWAEITARLPAVVTVGEKIAKPLRLDEAQRERARTAPVQVDDLDRMGLAASDVGAIGSPTSVTAVTETAGHRAARIVAGTAEPRELVADALQAIEPLIRTRRDPLPELPVVLERSEDREVALVVSDERGGLLEGMTGWISELRRSLTGYWPSVVWIGPAPSVEAHRALEDAGAMTGYWLRFDGPYDPHGSVGALDALRAARPQLAGLLLPSDGFHRELAGRWCARRGLGAVGDATEIAVAGEGALEFRKPSFGDRTVATIRCRTRPAVATVRTSLFPPAIDARGRFFWRELRGPPVEPDVRRGSEGEEPVEGTPPDAGGVVVAVGTGVGGPDRLGPIREAARRWGAAVVGTRRVIDAGWLPPRLQVGVTGRALAPRLAVLLGVRGSPHHMAGWRRAGAILAVNSDPGAPVFTEVDVGVVGTVDAILPELVEPLAALLTAVPSGGAGPLGRLEAGEQIVEGGARAGGRLGPELDHERRPDDLEPDERRRVRGDGPAEGVCLGGGGAGPLDADVDRR